jgi:hypothetical protein
MLFVMHFAVDAFLSFCQVKRATFLLDLKQRARTGVKFRNGSQRHSEYLWETDSIFGLPAAGMNPSI